MKRATAITAALLRRWRLPEPDGKQGKEDRGQVLVVGGSQEIPGAVILAALGAMRAGAGKLQIATGRGVAAVVAVAVPEARVIGVAQARDGELARRAVTALRDQARSCDAVLIGPGMTAPTAGLGLLDACLAHADHPTLIVDAGPLAGLSRRWRGDRRVILTPHAGEMAQLCGLDRSEVMAHPLEIARATAARLGVVVALKGEVTHVVAPDGTAFTNTAGNPGLGTSGSGDVLSGVIAGLCARGADPVQAAVWGVHLHARAGDALARRIGPLGYLARELPAEMPALLAVLDRHRRRR